MEPHYRLYTIILLSETVDLAIDAMMQNDSNLSININLKTFFTHVW